MEYEMRPRSPPSVGRIVWEDVTRSIRDARTLAADLRSEERRRTFRQAQGHLHTLAVTLGLDSAPNNSDPQTDYTFDSVWKIREALGALDHFSRWDADAAARLQGAYRSASLTSIAIVYTIAYLTTAAHELGRQDCTVRVVDVNDYGTGVLRFGSDGAFSALLYVGAFCDTDGIPLASEDEISRRLAVRAQRARLRRPDQ